MILSDAKRMKQADRAAIVDRGIGSLVLMERAAGLVAQTAAKIARSKSAAVFCGPGNNGGDGVAAARLLMAEGFAVRAYLVGEREKMTADTAEMEKRLTAAGGELRDFDPAADFEEPGVIVDALFGVGLSRPLAGRALQAVQLINRSAAPVVSADIASGVSADDGCVPGTAVRADVTVTFSMAKPGHFIEPGCIYCGELVIGDIGIPDDLLREADGGVRAVTGISLPRRPRLSHKGDYGKLGILGGSVGYTGAPSLCARAALRAGAGLVWLGVPREIYEITAVKNDEAMPFPLSSEEGRLSPQGAAEAVGRLEGWDLVTAGPGLGRGEGTRALTEMLLQSDKPLILDADGLWALSGMKQRLKNRRAVTVLTPHEGEFDRLWPERSGNRLADARAFAEEYGCILVLKGHRSLAAFPDGTVYVIAAGNPGMAKGGSGDVLAGVLGAMLGQFGPEQAVPAGLWLHARAGDLAAQALGEYAVTASDIIEKLAQAGMESLER